MNENELRKRINELTDENALLKSQLNAKDYQTAILLADINRLNKEVKFWKSKDIDNEMLCSVFNHKYK